MILGTGESAAGTDDIGFFEVSGPLFLDPGLMAHSVKIGMGRRSLAKTRRGVGAGPPKMDAPPGLDDELASFGRAVASQSWLDRRVCFKLSSGDHV